jgi:hypothetical protein
LGGCGRCGFVYGRAVWPGEGFSEGCRLNQRDRSPAPRSVPSSHGSGRRPCSRCKRNEALHVFCRICGRP